jgi:pre-mRNA-splicing factor ISY1
MARNEEKALTLFNKWHTFKKDFHSGAGNRRPLVSTECQSLPEAEKNRRDIIREITKKIAMIQNGNNNIIDIL